MKRTWILAHLLLMGCASREPMEEPTVKTVPAKLIADEGASLYVFEGPKDWVDDLAPEVPEWIGPEALKKVLRYALSQRSMHFIGHADFQSTEGYPAEATLFNPDAQAHSRTPGTGSVGFRVKLTARSLPAPPESGLRFSVTWSAEQLTDTPDKAGLGVRRSTEPIEMGTTELPAGAALLVRQPKAGGREYVLLLRIVSLRDR